MKIIIQYVPCSPECDACASVLELEHLKNINAAQWQVIQKYGRRLDEAQKVIDAAAEVKFGFGIGNAVDSLRKALRKWYDVA